MKQYKRQKDTTYKTVNTVAVYNSPVKFTQSEPTFRMFAEEGSKGPINSNNIAF